LNTEKIRTETLKTPYTYRPDHPRKPSIKIDSDIVSLKIKEKKISKGEVVRVFKLGKESTIRFSPSPSHIEIEFFVERGTNFYLTATSGKKSIHTQHIYARTSGIKTITLNTFYTDQIMLKGVGIWIKKICFWICEDSDSWEGPINSDCGFGLPVINILNSKYLEEAFAEECDPHWAVAACRLGPKNLCALKGKNFDDLKEILEMIRGEGIRVPVGWNVMEQKGESLSGSNGKEPSISISPYDLLLMQSQNPDIAKVLGLYWVDRSAQDNEYYDYKVVAEWPQRTLWRLKNKTTFEDLETGRRLFYIFYKDECIFLGSKAVVVNRESRFAKVTRGIAFDYPNNTVVKIFFCRPVKEVQVFIRHEGDLASLEAFSSLEHLIDYHEIKFSEGVLAVHAEDLKYVVLKGKGIILYRLHYDSEFLEYGQRHAIICGLKKAPEIELPAPTGLKATCLLGSITEVDEQGREVQRRFRVGLRWNLPVGEDNGLVSNAPVGYLIERTDPWGQTVLVTGMDPVYVVPVDSEIQGDEFKGQRDCTGREIKERQYFEDSVIEKGRYKYRVAAVDLFGRRSKFSRASYVELLPPKPPHPVDVTAKFIDFNSYNFEDDNSVDPNLSGRDIDWLKENRTSAIVVSWRWPKEIQNQFPDVTAFRVYFKEGWLNLLRGTVTEVEDTNDGYILHTDLQHIRAGALADEWLRQGKIIYRVKTNTGGSNITITVSRPPGFLDLNPEQMRPKGNETFVLPVTKLVAEGGMAIDYKQSENWGEPIYEHFVMDPSQEEYKVYIPYPSFESTETEKVRYGQVAVSTVSDGEEGAVSPPASIFSIYRNLPESPKCWILPALKATPADFYGKSSFPLRWERESGLKYYVYRAMDESIYQVDWSFRPRPELTAEENRVFPEGWSEEKRQQVAERLNRLNTFSKDDSGRVQAFTYYRELNDEELMVLASLDGNEAAFTKLNDLPIDPESEQYRDRLIPGEPSTYTPDRERVLYVDSTLDGRASNRYLYRLRAVDEIGNMSDFSLPTPPIEIPRVTPPPAPSITSVEGGDRKITIRWSFLPGYGIAGYLVYRSDAKDKAGDWRKMELLKKSPSDTYSVEVQDPSPLEFEYEDDTVEPRKRYYYGVVAVSKDDNDRDLRSVMSAVKSGQAYDLTPPEPPNIDTIEWVRVGEDGAIYSYSESVPAGQMRYPAVYLKWSSPDAELTCLVQYRLGSDEGFMNASEWLPPGVYEYIHRNEFTFQAQEYRIKVINRVGNSNTSAPVMLQPPSP
jgi:hypothetical protein